MKLAIDFPLIINVLKKLVIILEKYFGEVLLTLGSGLAVYNLTGFTHQSTRFYTPPKPTALNYSYWQGNYYYDQWQKILIALGVVLLIVGILIIKHRKNKAGRTDGQLLN